MSYSLFDSDNYLGDVASNAGWKDFALWASQQAAPIAEFVRDGHTDDPQGLAAALDVVTAKDPEVDGTRQLVLEAAQKADEVLIISDGTAAKNG